MNGLTDFMDDFGPFVALGRSDNRGSAPLPAGMREAATRVNALLSAVETSGDTSKLIVHSLAKCIMDNGDDPRDAAEIWSAWADELVGLFPAPSVQVMPPPPARSG